MATKRATNRSGDGGECLYGIKDDEGSVRDNPGSRANTGLDAVRGLRSRKVLLAGVESVAGAARLAIAASEDMIAGNLTAQEATVLNTTSGRVLKASELYLKYARGQNPLLALPESD